MDHQLGGGGGSGAHQQAPPHGTAQLQLLIQHQAASRRGIDPKQAPSPPLHHQLLLQQQPQPHQNPQLQPHQPPPAHLPCPRCNSRNTKFCYYNNYSLSQPRYFCKGCRRYWTHGGTLRNVPVGGGCRKSKRPKLAEPATGDDQRPGTQIAAPHRFSTINAAAGPNPNLRLINSSNMIIGSSSSSTSLLPPLPMNGSLYTGGFLSSLGAIHQPRPPLSPFSQPASGATAADHLESPLLRGFALPSFGSILQAATSAGPCGDAAGNRQDWLLHAGGGSMMGNVNLQPPRNMNNDEDDDNNNSSNNDGGHVGTCAANQWLFGLRP